MGDPSDLILVVDDAGRHARVDVDGLQVPYAHGVVYDCAVGEYR